MLEIKERLKCMQNSVMKYVERHLTSDLIIESVIMTADYKTNNREMKKLRCLFDELSENMELMKEVYKILLDHENVVTRLHVSAECLRAGIFIKESVKNLEEISKQKDIGIISFNAEMTLKVWNGEFEGNTL